MSARNPPKKPDSDPVSAPQGPIALGKVGRAHGLRGAFFVAGRDEPIPREYREVLIGPTPAAAKTAVIRASHMQGDRPLLACSLSETREAAEALTGQLIFVARSRIPAKEQGDLRWGDLPGVEIVDCVGKVLGRVEDVYNAGASDIIVVRDERGRSADIPLTPDYFDASQSVTVEGTARRIHLAVSADTFDELWSEVKA